MRRAPCAVRLAIAAAAWSAGLGSPVARADKPFAFQVPSGNIACYLGPGAEGGTDGAVGCEIGDHTYVSSPRPQTCHLAWGDRFYLAQGNPVTVSCHGDTLRTGDLPTLDYGETAFSGAIRCGIEETGVTCTDNSTGHFFRVSRDLYQVR
ncbi:MAG: DUF6636 domain-containing protein [Mycobacterium sp.]